MRLKKIQDTSNKPDWIRLPRNGTVCPHSGLNRSAMDKLVRAQELNGFRPPVKSKTLKLAGDKRGIVLVNYRSATGRAAWWPLGGASGVIR
jgi:hypothetical protein